jgi:AcrR family transcriptional regulator
MGEAVTVVGIESDTRSRILSNALDLVAERGFAATSTREVCERLGFTKAALYYHFKSKDDLLVALVAPVLEALSGLVHDRPVRSDAGARRSVAAAYAALVAEHNDLMRVLYDDPSVRDHAAMKAVRPMYQRLFRLLAGSDSPDTAELAQARAATGAVHAALLRGEPGEDRQILLAAAVSAACGALGLSQM